MSKEGKARRAEGRSGRRERWEASFSPWSLAATGAVVAMAFLFQRSLAVRAAMFLCFLFAALASGKKVSLVATIIVSAGIVAANLFLPVGRVLARVGTLRITQTALVEGLNKALVFEGLLYISKASILPGLRLPGRFGALAAAAFVYYDRIVEYKGSIHPATLIEDVDHLMLMLWNEGTAKSGTEASASTRGAAAAALIAAVILAYLPFFF